MAYLCLQLHVKWQMTKILAKDMRNVLAACLTDCYRWNNLADHRQHDITQGVLLAMLSDY